MVNKSAKKNGHGGARPGAGRPKSPIERKKVSFKLRVDLLERVSEFRDREGLGASETIERLLEEGLSKVR